MQPNPHTVKDELLKAYPKKTARKRRRTDRRQRAPRRWHGSRDQANVPNHAGRHHPAGCTYAAAKAWSSGLRATF